MDDQQRELRQASAVLAAWAESGEITTEEAKSAADSRASERKKSSVIPKAFWWLSLAGGMCLLVYALHRRDPVFVLGQGAGLVVYVRNLVLIRQAGTQRPPSLGAK